MATTPSKALAGTSGQAVAGTSQGRSLYERLGGHEGILKLIKPFYADIRQHTVLGPIFNAHIHDWPPHLNKIADFWALQTGGGSRYRGSFGAAHVSLGIGAEHFQRWLALWEFNNARQLEPGEAAEMNALAQQLAGRLSAITRGRQSLTIGTPESRLAKPAGMSENLA
jgi:hemoglobin